MTLTLVQLQAQLTVALGENQALKSENASLKDENARLKASNADLAASVSSLTAVKAQLTAQSAALQKDLAAVREQLSFMTASRDAFAAALEVTENQRVWAVTMKAYRETHRPA